MAKTLEEQEEIVIPDAEDNLNVPDGYKEDEWADLSVTEREAVMDTGEEEKEPEDEIADDVLEELTKDEEAAAEEVHAPEPSGEVTPAAGMSDEELLSFRPVIYESKLPTPVEEVIPSELQEKLDTLDSKYDEGEMTLKEYNKERDAINRQIIADNMRQTQVAREEARYALVWKEEQRAFFEAHKEYELSDDGSIKGKALFGALNNVIKELDRKTPNMPGMQLLLKAHKEVSQMFGAASDKAPAKDAAPKIGVKPAAKVPDSVTLGDVPIAKNNNTDGAWGAIDKLEGEAYEAMLERLSPEQRKRYEAAIR